MNALTLLLGLYSLIVALWMARRVIVAVLRNRMAFLTPQYGSFQSNGNAPLVSVVIPAKDEAKAIGGCLDSVLAQGYPKLEVIVIDDRSRDRTAEVVEHIARRDPRGRLF